MFSYFRSGYNSKKLRKKENNMNEDLKITNEGDKTFELSEKVTHKKNS
jgi:hypothetical protein